MNKLFVCIVVLAVVAFAAVLHGQSSREPFSKVGVDGFAALADSSGVQLIDVRTDAEYSEGHLPGAMLIDVKSAGFDSVATARLDRSRVVAVYCRSGRRSADAARRLAASGYRVVNLDGGIMAWQKAARPVVK